MEQICGPKQLRCSADSNIFHTGRAQCENPGSEMDGFLIERIRLNNLLSRRAVLRAERGPNKQGLYSASDDRVGVREGEIY